MNKVTSSSDDRTCDVKVSYNENESSRKKLKTNDILLSQLSIDCIRNVCEYLMLIEDRKDYRLSYLTSFKDLNVVMSKCDVFGRIVSVLLGRDENLDSLESSIGLLERAHRRLIAKKILHMQYNGNKNLKLANLLRYISTKDKDRFKGVHKIAKELTEHLFIDIDREKLTNTGLEYVEEQFHSKWIWNVCELLSANAYPIEKLFSIALNINRLCSVSQSTSRSLLRNRDLVLQSSIVKNQEIENALHEINKLKEFDSKKELGVKDIQAVFFISILNLNNDRTDPNFDYDRWFDDLKENKDVILKRFKFFQHFDEPEKTCKYIHQAFTSKNIKSVEFYDFLISYKEKFNKVLNDKLPEKFIKSKCKYGVPVSFKQYPDLLKEPNSIFSVLINNINEIYNLPKNFLNKNDNNYKNNRDLIINVMREANDKDLNGFIPNCFWHEEELFLESLKWLNYTLFEEEFLDHEIPTFDQVFNDIGQDFCLECVSRYPQLGEWFGDYFEKPSRDSVLKAIEKTNGRILQAVSKWYEDDDEIVCAALKKTPNALEWVSLKLIDNKSIVSLAIEQDGKQLIWASYELMQDQELINKALLAKDPLDISLYVQTLKNAEKGDIDIPKLTAELELRSIALHGGCLTDKMTIIEKMNQYGVSLPIPIRQTEELANDKEFALFMVNSNGMLLQYFSDDIKRNKIIVDCAVRQNPDASKFSLLDVQSFG